MSQNVELAREAIRGIAQRDLTVLLDLADPQIEWRSFFSPLAEGGSYWGHEGLRSYVNDLRETFESGELLVDDLLDAGDVVVGIGRIYFRGKASGVETDVAAAWVFRFRGGKLVYFRAFSDPEQALESVGLRE